MSEGIDRKLQNKHFALRHGESKANIKEIILSDPEAGGSDEFTLTEKGEQQVREAIKKAKKDGLLDDKTVIYSSPLSRTWRTAEIAKEILGVPGINMDDRLRERWFGNLEREHKDNYQKVWDKDKLDPGHKEDEVESAQEVQIRTLSLIKELEEKYKGRTILLVSHGDALQILHTGVHNKSASDHRDIPHLETAEVRGFNIEEDK
jgi:broad specificity phosphatase PhoE